MEPFLQCQFIFFQRFWVFKPDKDVRIRRVGAVGGDVRCESGLMRKGQLFTLTLVTKSLVYMVFWILRGECREKKKQVRLNTKQSCKNNSECIDNFRHIPFHFRVEFSLLKWSDFLYRNFKMFGLCRLFHSSSFGASIPVSIKEFLWDLSFHAKLYF